MRRLQQVDTQRCHQRAGHYSLAILKPTVVDFGVDGFIAHSRKPNPPNSVWVPVRIIAGMFPRVCCFATLGGMLMGYFLPFEGAVGLVAVVALVFVMAVFDGFKRKKR